MLPLGEQVHGSLRALAEADLLEQVNEHRVRLSLDLGELNDLWDAVVPGVRLKAEAFSLRFASIGDGRQLQEVAAQD